MTRHARQTLNRDRRRNARRALVLAPLLGASAISTTACTTTDLELLDLALQLYVASEYLNGDCPFGQETYYDTWRGQYSCGYGVKDKKSKAADNDPYDGKRDGKRRGKRGSGGE